jgi:hemolysin activation/secretion protein
MFSSHQTRFPLVRINAAPRSCSGVRSRLALALISVFLGSGALAQSPSQITPRSFEPVPPLQGGDIVIPQATGPQAPAGADQLFVNIADVQIDNGFPALREQTQAIVGEIVGRRVSAADLFAAARRIEQAYIAAGYGLARIVLPAQNLRDGAVLHLTVIDGYIERIDTSALPEAIRAHIADVLAPLAGRRGLTMATIERALLLAGDTPGTALRSTLTPGSEPGAGVLVIEARSQLVAGFVSFDNTLSDELGTYTTNVGVDLNSPTGHGEQLYFRAAGKPGAGTDLFTSQPLNRILAAGVTVPLGTDGLTANFEVTDARTTPSVAAGDLGTTSAFSRFSLRLNYPLVRSRDLTVNVQGIFDDEQEKVTLISPVTQELSLDRLRILRGSGNVAWFAPGNGVVTGWLTGSFGIGGRRAPADDSDATPLSRQGADPIFHKLDMSVGYTQPVFQHLTIDLAARGQTSFNHPLASAEQISLASASGLSTIDSGQVQGDSGFVVRGEAQFPFIAANVLPGGLSVDNAGAMLSPYLFGAYGRATLAEPTVLEATTTRGTAYGIGVRLGATPRAKINAMSANLEYGRYTLTTVSDDDQHSNRFSFAVVLQF